MEIAHNLFHLIQLIMSVNVSQILRVVIVMKISENVQHLRAEDKEDVLT